ncbi:MAG: hypothetical protein IPJ07_25640 [Acidobacteria bacterium]|nr:hypothetical protein [Acidobacteriota bacterium]MBK9706315.1 hypothetical protein [Acidobacteriota bacterium]
MKTPRLRFLSAAEDSVEKELVVIRNLNSYNTVNSVKPPVFISAQRDIIGATVVSDKGHLLGQVINVLQAENDSHVIYQIKPSGLKNFLKGDVWLSHDHRLSYLEDRFKQGLRIIAPLEAVYPSCPEATNGNDSKPGRYFFHRERSSTGKSIFSALLLVALGLFVLLSFWPR